MTRHAAVALTMALIVIGWGCGDDKGNEPTALTTFQQTIGGDRDDEARGVAATSDGGFVVASLRDGWISEEPSAIADLHFTTYDAEGNEIDDQVIKEDHGTWDCSIAQTADGGIVLTGHTAPSGRDPYIIKTDAAGSVQWDKDLATMSYDALPSGILQLSNGSYAVVGQRWGRWKEVVSAGISSEGDVIWVNETQMSMWDSHRGQDLVETLDGGCLITGSVGSPANPGWRDMYLVKVDGSGVTEWTKTIGGEDIYERGECIVTSSGGDYLVAGFTADRDWAEVEDVYLVKLDSQGEVIWEQTYGGDGRDAATSVIATADGGCVLAGWTESSGAGGQDVYLLRVNTDGDLLWERTFGEAGNDVGTSVAAAADGGFLIVGRTAAADATQDDILLIKTDSQGQI